MINAAGDQGMLSTKARILMVIVWLAAVVALMSWQIRRETTPGTAGTTLWTPPTELAAFQEADKGLVVMAIHPMCPCTRASLAEFANFAATDGQANVLLVLACVPPHGDQSWMEADTCRQAQEIAGVRFMMDPDGRIASALGMRTSGHVVAYAADRKLLFSGGITPARGHTGPNSGLIALRTMKSARSRTRIPDDGGTSYLAMEISPVFGCPLVSPTCSAEACEVTQP